MDLETLKKASVAFGLVLVFFGLFVSIHRFGTAYNISWGMSDAIKGIAELIFGIFEYDISVIETFSYRKK